VRIRVEADGSRVVPAVKDPPLRQIIVPTTLSGAEFSNLGGCIDPIRKVKDLYTGRLIGGQVVILDPAVTVHTPPSLWLSTGIRAVDHAVETICSRKPQPFTDATCIHALRLLSKSLPANHATPSDLSARLDSQLAVWLATTGRSIGGQAMASAINSAQSPMYHMAIVRASCCQVFCARTARSTLLSKRWSHKRWVRTMRTQRLRWQGSWKHWDSRLVCAMSVYDENTTTQ
jgi:alcohol dehydrogenase class IV